LIGARLMKYAIVVMSILFLLSSNTFSKEFNVIERKINPDKITDIRIQNFNINSSELARMVSSGRENIKINNFPTGINSNEPISLRRERDIYDNNTIWVVNTDSGEVQVRPPDILSYSGEILGQNKSRIYLNVANGELFGVIRDEAGEYFEIKPNNADNVDGNNPHFLVSSDWSEIQSKLNLACGTADNAFNFHELSKEKTGYDKILDIPLLEVPIGAEGEYFFFEQMGKDRNKALSYMANVMALSARIYEEFADVTFVLSFVRLQESEANCPYATRPTLTQKLFKMNNAWKGVTAKRAIAVLYANLLKQPEGNIVAGISRGGNPYEGSLCDNGSSYCVFGIRGTYNYPTTYYTWDVNVATHEMGHNFGLPHTHSCFWLPNMIDTCITSTVPYESDGCNDGTKVYPIKGTIMSYCHTTNSSHSVNLIFHERELPLLRTAAANATGCVKEPDNPIVKLLSPHGVKEFRANSEIEIRWTSSKVNFVTIKYSTDNGESWVDIVIKHYNSDSIYTWKLPDILAKNVLVAINDFYDPSVADTSVMPFSILKPTLNVTAPVQGQEFGQMESVEIQLYKVIIESTVISFSSDAGNNWEIINPNFQGTSLLWELPDIVSDKCLIKAFDKSDESMTSVSGMFSIGVETAKIIYPTDGLGLCIGDTTKVIWESKYISSIILEYSVDEGANWRKVRIGSLDGSMDSISWRIPDRAGDKCKIRLASLAETSKTLAESGGYFSIDTCSTTSIDDKPVPFGRFVKSVMPNPTTGKLTVEFAQDIDLTNINILLFDINGKSIDFQDYKINLNQNNRFIVYHLDKLPQGKYFMMIRIDGRTETIDFEVIK